VNKLVLQSAVFTLIFSLSLLTPVLADEPSATLNGSAQQGGLLFGETQAGNRVFLDKQEVLVSPRGDFVIGFGRDETGQRTLRISNQQGSEETHLLDITIREYAIERVDGLPPSTVTPDPSLSKRIREEGALVSSARSRRDDRTDYVDGFAWPATGRISGVYGSQRVLNGEPRRPHYGLDIAADEGSPVYAPADGIVTLAHPAMFYSGGTLILDHGQGLNSTFLHLSKILVESGTVVRKGDLIAQIGSTGRASGPHLDWRMNWLDRRVDPQLLLTDKPQTKPNP
jgi:murein DD-endopeptidase MepM/ murein hydrolase activator NlpD